MGPSPRPPSSRLSELGRLLCGLSLAGSLRGFGVPEDSTRTVPVAGMASSSSAALATAGCCPSPLDVSFPQGSVYLWVQSTPLPLATSPGPPQEDTNCSAGEDRPVELTTPPTLASGSQITGSIQPVSQRVDWCRKRCSRVWTPPPASSQDAECSLAPVAYLPGSFPCWDVLTQPEQGQHFPGLQPDSGRESLAGFVPDSSHLILQGANIVYCKVASF